MNLDELKSQSEKFHMFEWLRSEALRGNKHAEVAVLELIKLNEPPQPKPIVTLPITIGYGHTPKQLRTVLYERQRRLFNLREGYESVALPGDLLKANPFLFK